ncbi:MAG: ATP-binding protein, partial [Holophagae bacterium]
MTGATDFRRRAFREARRYAGDDWVFVRELLQNARDAGAERVEITVERHGGRDVIRVRDDGCGMTYDHARRYLFTLYATSKRDQRDRAGRFGIGFWSILRFDPDRVVVRSAPVGGPPWQVRFSGDLERVERSAAALPRGTEVELGRTAGSDDPAHRVWLAVRRNARHLKRLGSDDAVLEVRVNSRLATSAIDLPAPSLTVRRRGLTVAVALGATPRVDLLAHGLRVRTAATLDELLTGPETTRRRRLPTSDELVPQVIVDSRRLQLLMARGDARTDRELRRGVALGRRAVRRLVRGQLDRAAGLGRLARAGARAAALIRGRPVRRFAAASVVVALVAFGARWAFNRPRPVASVAAGSAAALGPGGVGRPAAILDPSAAEWYLGPTVDRLWPVVPAIDLTYRPPTRAPMFAIVR